MTPIDVLIHLAGLSQREAADFLGVSVSTIDKQTRGVRTTPAGILAEVSGLIRRQALAAEQALLEIRPGLEQIELGYPADDCEARSMGWPSVGAWGAVAARIVAATSCPVVFVPRGTTVGTAKAADLREGEKPPL